MTNEIELYRITFIDGSSAHGRTAPREAELELLTLADQFDWGNQLLSFMSDDGFFVVVDRSQVRAVASKVEEVD